MDTAAPFSQILPNSLQRDVYRYWRGLCQSLGRLPRRREIDPLDLPTAFLPTALILVREPGGRFRCDLAGARVQEMHKRTMAGEYLDEMVPAGPADVRRSIYTRSLDERCAAYCRLRFSIPGREIVASDRMYLPALANTGDDVCVLFSCQIALTVADLVGQKSENGLYALAFDDPIL